jgi:hypothetical protein
MQEEKNTLGMATSTVLGLLEKVDLVSQVTAPISNFSLSSSS